MKTVSDNLKTIADELGLLYQRASNIEEANILNHYESEKYVILYVGQGKISKYFEGAAALQKVEVQIYVMAKQPVMDAKAEQIDVELKATAEIATAIVNRLDVAEHIMEYELTPVAVFDDKFIGYIIETELTLYTNAC